MSAHSPLHVLGGGLAGTECAFQLGRRGLPVVLWEMRPTKSTPAHKTGDLAELVCSNSLRSDDPFHAAGLLKREMEAFGSLVVGAARRAAVPAGSALAVDRERFAAEIHAGLAAVPTIEIRREEATVLPPGEVVVASGPLTSEALTGCLQALLGSEWLYFYDALAPIVEADSLDFGRLFAQSRWDKGDGADYLNAPFDKEGYLAFYEALTTAELAPLHDFEKALFFEGCLPIEELARRGVDTLRFGSMKPVGLRGPDGRRPYAVVQLRQENLAKTQYNLVGFQSRMKWGDQGRVLRMIPGLEAAEFVRFGSVHRNTFVNSPTHLDKLYRLKAEPRVRLAGQLTGVEGYLESAATGLAAALHVVTEREGRTPEPFPPTTALGALGRHLTESDPRHFQPANVNYGLFEELPERAKKLDRRRVYAERAHRELLAWAERQGLAVEASKLTPELTEVPA